MTDDIETLRGILCAGMIKPEEALATLERVEKELTERPWIEKQRGDIMRNLEIKAFGWECEANKQTDLRIRAESERDLLRAKLEKTKEAIEKWQEWWELPWEAKRPDIASQIHKHTLAILAELPSKEKT